MSCHNEKNQTQESQGSNHSGHGKHMWLMLLCCLIPLMLILIWPSLNLSGSSILAKIAPYGFFILCPLMHIAMMFFMRGHGNDKEQGSNNEKTAAAKGGSCH